MGEFGEDDFQRAVSAFEAAPFEAGMWTTGLDLLARAGGGWAGQLLGVSPTDGILFNAMTRMSPDVLAEWERRGGGVVGVNPRAASLLSSDFSITADDDFLSREERRLSPFYQEIFIPFDAAFISVGKLSRSHDVQAVVCAVRSTSQGHAQATDHGRIAALLPYIDAALRWQLMLNRRDIHAAVQPLEALRIPAFLCDVHGRVLATTEPAEAILKRGDLFRLRAGKVFTPDKRCDERFQAALRLASSRPGIWPKVVRPSTLVLRDTQGAARRVDVAPLPAGSAHFTSAAACIVAITGQPPAADPSTLLALTYSFSPAEAAVALDLARGLSARDIAEKRQVSVATVRVQVQAVLQKAGVTKATALAAIVGRLHL